MVVQSLKHWHEDVEGAVVVVPVSSQVVADLVVVQVLQACVVELTLQVAAPVVAEVGAGAQVVLVRNVPTSPEELKATVPMADCSAREQNATDAKTLDSRACSEPAFNNGLVPGGAPLRLLQWLRWLPQSSHLLVKLSSFTLLKAVTQMASATWTSLPEHVSSSSFSPHAVQKPRNESVLKRLEAGQPVGLAGLACWLES